MIWFYSGTPGSGKSFHVAKDIFLKLGQKKESVISTVNIDTSVISKNGKKKIGRFTYIPITEITPKLLYEYAARNHKKGKEGQTLVIMDECQIIFNPREFTRDGRIDWINFFTRHRHLGYNFILISQFDRLIDRQIRSLFEYEVKHRKINNFGILFFLPFTAFYTISFWYGVKQITAKEFFLYKKKYAAIYDSYIMFDEFTEAYGLEATGTDAQEAGAGGSPPTKRPEPEHDNNTLLKRLKTSFNCDALYFADLK